VGHNAQICMEFLVTLHTILLNLVINLFFVIQGMYLLCITNLVTSNKNNPCFFAQGCCLENKIS